MFRIFKKIALIAVAIALIGCSSLSAKRGETQSWSNEQLYEQAQAAFSERDWGLCAQYFSAFEGRAVLNHDAQQAHMNTAYCQWKDHQNAAALQSIHRFIQQYPAHPKLDYVFYLKGLVHFNDAPGLLSRFNLEEMSERDPQASRKAYEAFKEVVDRYPASPYAVDAARRMRYITHILAKYEAHVARYYYQRGAYIAAANRAQVALQQFQNAPAHEEALRTLILSYRALGAPQLAQDAERVLKSTFPESAALNIEANRADPSR